MTHEFEVARVPMLLDGVVGVAKKEAWHGGPMPSKIVRRPPPP